MKTFPCPEGCGAELTRHQRKHHAKLYCPANGAPAKQPRKCRFRECTTMFVPKPGNPQQEYCGKPCLRKETAAKRAERWQAGKMVQLEEPEPDKEPDKEAAHMGPLLRREEEAAKKASAYAPLMGEALEKITRELMGIAT
jgi:hypothetical protein